jgi:hypothetical protein
MWINPSFVWIFMVMFALFGVACAMIGRAFGSDASYEAGRRAERMTRQADPVRATVTPMPAALFPYVHPAAADERLTVAPPGSDHVQKRMAALIAETDSAFDAITAGIWQGTDGPPRPTAPTPIPPPAYRAPGWPSLEHPWEWSP